MTVSPKDLCFCYLTAKEKAHENNFCLCQQYPFFFLPSQLSDCMLASCQFAFPGNRDAEMADYIICSEARREDYFIWSVMYILSEGVYFSTPSLGTSKDPSNTQIHAHIRYNYRIAGKFGEDFNLAVWRILKNRQIKFSPIIKHDVIRITHAHIYFLHGMHGTSKGSKPP